MWFQHFLAAEVRAWAIEWRAIMFYGQTSLWKKRKKPIEQIFRIHTWTAAIFEQYQQNPF